MKTANYTETQTASGSNGRYPLSTETLDFIQDQIHLLEALAGVGGSNYILRLPGDGIEGVAVIYHNPKTDTTARKGETEMLFISTSPAYRAAMKYLIVKTERETITADGEKYLDARIVRRAQFSAVKGSEDVESYALSGFVNLSAGAFTAFPTNASLAAQLRNVGPMVLSYLKDALAEKLTSKTQKGVTRELLDQLKTSCVLSCIDSYAFFGETGYAVVVTEQGGSMVRQELIQGENRRYVRTFDGGSWGEWAQQVETAMHLDVKVVGGTVYLRHGALSDDCDIVLLRKKKRSAYRATGGSHSLAKNRGIVKKRLPKRQYVHFKGIILSKGKPGKWYVPKCKSVADKARDGDLIGKEMPSMCSSLFYVGTDQMNHVQGVRKKLVLKSVANTKGTAHRAYVPLGIQIARVNSSGGKDSGGEIVRLKYRVSQEGHRDPETKVMSYNWIRTFSHD